MENCYLAEANFIKYCSGVRLPGNLKLQVFTECAKLARLDFYMMVFLKIRPVDVENLVIFDTVKRYSLHDALSIAFAHMSLSLEGNGSSLVTISVMMDSTSPFMPFSPDADMLDMSLILVRNTAFSFVTCASLRQGRLDYWGYLKPFSPHVWYVLLGFCNVVTVLLIGQHLSLALRWLEFVNVFIKAWLDVGLTVLEGPGSTLKQMFRRPASDKLIILWMFGSFILVSIYKSIVTNDTTAPLVSSPPRTFKDLVDARFRIYSSPVRIWEFGAKFILPESLSRFRVGESDLDGEILRQFVNWLNSLPEKNKNEITQMYTYNTCVVVVEQDRFKT